MDSCISRVCGMTHRNFLRCWVLPHWAGRRERRPVCCTKPPLYATKINSQRSLTPRPSSSSLVLETDKRAWIRQTFLHNSGGASVKWPIRYIGTFFLQSGEHSLDCALTDQIYQRTEWLRRFEPGSVAHRFRRMCLEKFLVAVK
jgi:hypothetical protein